MCLCVLVYERGGRYWHRYNVPITLGESHTPFRVEYFVMYMCVYVIAPRRCSNFVVAQNKPARIIHTKADGDDKETEMPASTTTSNKYVYAKWYSKRRGERETHDKNEFRKGKIRRERKNEELKS